MKFHNSSCSRRRSQILYQIVENNFKYPKFVEVDQARTAGPGLGTPGPRVFGGSESRASLAVLQFFSIAVQSL
eukprot:216645-Hanusia_phi.AAC.2